jgi:hypothetical protein
MSVDLLIEEILPSDGNVIMETVKDSKGGKKVFLSGIFMQGEVQNRNGRVYPLSEISSAVDGAKQTIATHGGIFGELDHPQTLNVNMDRISHVIREIYMDGSNAVGKAELLETPMGMIAKELAKSGVRYGISSRGTGDVDSSGGVKGFRLVTCDLVVTPSAQGAILDPIYESLQRDIKGAEIMSLAESVRHDPKAQEYFRKEILKFISKIL